jgi:RNA polymerase sigma-70 factor (ECF subfamily)
MLLDRALDRVGREFEQGGKEALYDRLKVVLTGAEAAVSYARIGTELGMTEAAVKKAAQRLRHRYRDVLRELIAETVDEPGQVDDEIRALFAALAR